MRKTPVAAVVSSSLDDREKAALYSALYGKTTAVSNALTYGLLRSLRDKVAEWPLPKSFYVLPVEGTSEYWENYRYYQYLRGLSQIVTDRMAKWWEQNKDLYGPQKTPPQFLEVKATGEVTINGVDAGDNVTVNFRYAAPKRTKGHHKRSY